MASSWQPRKVDRLRDTYRPPLKRAQSFIRDWFMRVRGNGVVFEREEVTTKAKQAWIATFGEPTQTELLRAWEVWWTDRVNHALRDGCGMAFPGLGQGQYIVRRDIVDEAILTLTAVEKARAGHGDIQAAECELEMDLRARGLPEDDVRRLITYFRQASGL